MKPLKVEIVAYCEGKYHKTLNGVCVYCNEKVVEEPFNKPKTVIHSVQQPIKKPFRKVK